jgi:benzoate-CoA ligase
MTAHAPPPAEFNFAAHLLERNAARAARLAYVDDRERLTYGDLATRVRAFAAGLVALGLRRDERLLLLAHDTVDWPVAFLGCLHAGVVPVAVNTLLTAADYAYMLLHSRAQAAVVSGALLPTLRQAIAEANAAPRELIVSRAGADAGSDFHRFETLAAARATAHPADTLADEPAFWLYSSGSTGKPKGTVHTHGNLHWTDVTYGRDVLGLREDDVVYSAAKLFFAYGLGNALTFPLSAGATTLLLPDRPTPAAVFEKLTSQRASVFFGVPTLFAALLASPDLPSRERASLRRAVSAGEALPREIGERFATHFGCEILDGIGSTEMLHIFLSNRPGAVRYGTTGVPVPGYDVELRGEDGRGVADGEIGDLFVKGPSAALMYWANRDKSRATFQGEWTKTGDKYVRDADGYYVYSGRGDDMLKVSGQYVSPFEVEAALMRHPAVLEAAVIGRIDRDGLTRTKAFVVLKPGHGAGAALEDELKGFVKDKLAPFKYPRYLEFVVELPKTATGKIQRFRLREREEAR